MTPKWNNAIKSDMSKNTKDGRRCVNGFLTLR